ncbi:MAG: TaqI-like C-terminal specificity domain-containing protein [Sulfurimonas sp.]|jgi:hypothetical protein
MIKTIQNFKNENFYDATKTFFAKLNIPLYEITTKAIDKNDLFANLNSSFEHVQDIYAVGMITDEFFKNGKTDVDVHVKKDYDGVLIFAVELDSSTPSRKILADISRTFNREYKYTPVIILFKYGNKLSLSNTQRQKYKIKKEGEKATKVTILRDIDTTNPHTGHIKILNDMQLNAKVNSYETLYMYWQEVFNIELLQKRFYDRLFNIFENLMDTLEYPYKNFKDKQEFIVRLIGRIIFLKYLEKKDLIPVSKLIHQDNYYHKILEPLFFEVLNTPLDSRNYNILHEEDKQVPFLNGGLFQPHKDDFYYIDVEQHKSVNISDKYLKELLSLLNNYYFTVDESTSIEQEVGLDPELLGLVFENLLAYLNPETKEIARKQTGSYYTPRIIVDYMVDSSIFTHLTNRTKINHKELNNLVFNGIDNLKFSDKLEILTALQSLKILDPACGSGAYPMGMLSKIVYILDLIDIGAKEWIKLQSKEFQLKYQGRDQNYIRKLSIIENSIFCIDIQPIAIEISKLRFFLSLLVEEDKDNIEPLPNLEFKFVCANSLLPINYNKTNDFTVNIQELQELRNLYFYSSGNDKKNIISKYNIQKEIYFQNINKLFNNNMIDYDPFNITSVASFFDMEYMFNINDGFDIIISNPPYMRIQKIAKDISEEYKKIYQAATGSYDLYVIFVEQALRLISKNGVVNFIMPDRWVNSAFGKGLRKAAHGKISKLISFKDYQVFNASTYTSLIWLTEHSDFINYLELEKDLKTNNDLKLFLDEIKDDDYVEIDYDDLDSDGWILTNRVSENILKIIGKNKLKLNDVFEKIYTGLQTSNDQVYFLHDCKNIDNTLIVGFSEELNEEIVIEKDFTKPLLKGDDVHKYKKLYTDKVVIFPYSIEKIDDKEKAILMSEDIISFSFPKGYEYLKRCEAVLRNREKGKFDIDGEWYQFGRKQGMIGVEEEKILSRDISKGGDYSYDKYGEFYHATTVYGYKKYSKVKESYKFYLSILNSKLMWWYLQQVGTPLANGYYRYMPRYVENFPIPEVSYEESIPFEILVDYIIFLSDDSKDDINEYVSNSHIAYQFREVLDSMVYELYFRKQFKEKNIEFIKYVKEDFELNGDSGMVFNMNKSYELLNTPNNKIRNNLILIDIEFKDIIIPVKRSYNV